MAIALAEILDVDAFLAAFEGREGRWELRGRYRLAGGVGEKAGAREAVRGGVGVDTATRWIFSRKASLKVLSGFARRST